MRKKFDATNALVQTLMQKIAEMTQEDQRSAARTEELERQLNMLQSSMAHMNQVHQGSKAEYEVALMRVEEMSQCQRVEDQELAESLSNQLGQLRGEAASSYLHLEQRVQGEGVNMAKEYERLTNEPNEKATDNLHLRARYSSANQLLSCTRPGFTRHG